MAPELDTQNIERLLLEVQYLSLHYDKVATLTGEKFNVFDILKLRTNEVRTHSAFIAELLNTKGIHGQGDKFLKLFLKELKISSFDTTNSFVEVEKHIGSTSKDMTAGGQIDIIIWDCTRRNNVIVENKIYANDGVNQLLRYHNFDKNATLIYLNLDGTPPSNTSTAKILEEGDYKVISYKTEIANWLGGCIKEAAFLPTIRETLYQYLQLINDLTNQSKCLTMNKEIRELILKNPNYAKAIDDCNNELQLMLREAKQHFTEIFDELFPPKSIFLINGTYINVYWGMDGAGVFFGYQLLDGENNLSETAKGIAFGDILRGANGAIKSNKNHMGWFFPKPFDSVKQFERLNKVEILRIWRDKSEMRKFIEELIQQETAVTNHFKDRINQELQKH